MLEAVAKELEQNGSIPAGEKDKISKQIVILGEILKKERSFVKDQTANSFGYKGLGTELKHMLVELEKGAK
jgi:hypothetical protein